MLLKQSISVRWLIGHHREKTLPNQGTDGRWGLYIGKAAIGAAALPEIFPEAVGCLPTPQVPGQSARSRALSILPVGRRPRASSRASWAPHCGRPGRLWGHRRPRGRGGNGRSRVQPPTRARGRVGALPAPRPLHPGVHSAPGLPCRAGSAARHASLNAGWSLKVLVCR